MQSITTWLNNAARYPLLTKDQTIQLARRIQKAEPGSAQHTKLINKLCQHNLRLVAKYTRAYMGSGRRTVKWGDETTLDLLQEGYFGLRRAAAKFDPERGYTFATYANAWIRQAVGKYHVDKLSLVRVPESSAREIFYYNKHGQARNAKVDTWVAEASKAAHRAYSVASYDKTIPGKDGDMSLVETLSEDNLVLPQAERLCYDNYLFFMEEMGIEPDIAQVIVSYCKRGNLDTAMMKNKMPVTGANRRAVREAIEEIKARVA